MRELISERESGRGVSSTIEPGEVLQECYKSDALALLRAHPDYLPCGGMRARERNNDLLLVRCLKVVAAIVYKSTYCRVTYREDKSYSTTCCWDVCGKYLNRIKVDRCKQEAKQNPTDLFLASELKYFS